MGNIGESVLARLKNKSKEQSIPLQQLLNLFCQEEFLRRLSVSNYKENLILKGGFLLYSISGIIGRTKTPFSIDFGVGDIIVPYPVERTLPVLLPEFEKPEVLTYSLESTVAEKLDAIISLMEATGRMKDFYDIYYLATTFDFDGRELQEAIYGTLSNRGTPYEKDSVAVIARLTKNNQIQKRWDNFCKKTLKYKLDFTDVVNIIIDFTLPPFESMVVEDKFFKNWSYKDRKYI